MEFIDLAPRAHVSGTVVLPGSKSISNRALLLAALASGTTKLSGLLDSDDTQVMRGALAKLGVACSELSVDGDIAVTGCGGQFSGIDADIFVGNAGTAARSLVATLALAAEANASYRIDGVARMRERPIGDLVDALKLIGAHIEYTANPGFPPLHITGGSIDISQPIPIRGDVSSQFLTGLLMALPLVTARTGKPATIELVGELISKPYIEITLAMMAQFGVVVERDGWKRFHVPPTRYVSPGKYWVEGDASSASYFIAAAAIGGGPIRVVGVGKDALQGDVKFADAMAKMGARISYEDNAIIARAPENGRLRAIQSDMNHIPDAAMTLAIAALFADGTTRLTNIASWRVKETDRIAAMATELRKLGAIVEEGEDFIAVQPVPKLNAHAAIDTYDDHRIAMCFSLVSLGASGVAVRINDPKCVGKTFPKYFDVFAALG
ncbi:MAG: 3-phosphoshikimate 1-carboxyvinyltransferase [Betaproteobacteria bacterium]|nr:MAG: 3-phosphoshikimate 1-carboxyvinyltransferase [Betaproteobacteria bacterium]